ncbi:hypothetical protein HU200_002098 [Digitaria exilis]|uniref:HMA domain-containing protein n=1 Tax=Digitaria exilis TaxID=1010633 RepID=A0A835FYL0_9POAL|nr:hypothetical protein HU200_002098 [Digitaria exilis]CAB3448089.1 unnamed protein product [Digitaria exilis]CAB3504544.1 unnamed protein product [Digitaria exilis]CAB3504549.1 unnamed protein product [Digitaria exilis]
MGGAMRQLLGLLGAINGRPRERKKKMVLRRPLQVVELRVRMDCERCEREVKKALSGMRGVQHVEVSRLQQKVTVTGEVDPLEVLWRARSTGKKAEPWAHHQNAPGGYYYAPALYGIGAAQLPAHDAGRWANPAAAYGYHHPAARSVEAAIGAEHLTDLFSEDNPNACSVM